MSPLSFSSSTFSSEPPVDLALFASYKESVEALLKRSMDRLLSQDGLTQACKYALLTPGKRLRPILLLAIADALGARWSLEEAAASVEMFHAASLIADDLPCMDDDDFRRGRPSVHKQFDESTAILATYGLISEGYRAVYANAMELERYHLPDAAKRGLIAVKCVADNAGLQGAAGGQYIDLKIENPTTEQLEEVLQKKTATIFEISCVLGWVFGGGSLEELPRVKNLAFSLGMAFQILDDIEDLKQKDERAPINYALAMGESQAKTKVLEYLHQVLQLIDTLKLNTPIMQTLVGLLMAKMK